MDFIDFVVHWFPVAIIGVSIYLYVQKWLCHPQSERGLHWRGMFLKFACWPVFFLGFVLSLLDADIPYIPTSKQAVKGFTPFMQPLLIHQLLFILTILIVVVNRTYFTPEARLALSSGEVWGMVAFATIAFLMTSGGTYAALQSRKLKTKEAWAQVDLTEINNNSSGSKNKLPNSLKSGKSYTV